MLTANFITLKNYICHGWSFSNRAQRGATILSLLLVWFSSLAHAQEVPELSLSDAIQLGLAENFGIQIEEKNVEIAENNNNWGAAGRWPTINFSISQDNNFRNVDNPASFLQGLTISNDVSPSVGVNWVLFGGFRVLANRERLQTLEELSRGNAQVVIENAVEGIINQYYLVQLEQERLSVLRKVFNLSKDRYDYVKLRGELGSAVTFDILQEQTAYLTDSSNYVTQEISAVNARRNLNLLMGQEVGERYSLSDSLAVTPNEYAVEDLYERMIASNSNLRNQHLNLEIAQADTRLNKAELYPQLSLNINGSYNISRQDLSQAELQRPLEEPITIARTTNYAAGLTLNYLLFDGGRVRRAIENSYTQQQIGQLQIEELKLTLRNELAATYDLYNVRQKLLSIAELSVSSADLNLRLAEERFRNGTINSFNYRDIQLNYLNAALNHLQAEYNLIESETALLRLTGGITSEYGNIN